MIDLTTKTDAQIDNLIRNHEEKDARDRPLYPVLLEERARRAQARSSLNFEKSLDLLRRAAIERRCVSYGDLAQASDVPWSEARHKMNGARGHLDLLLDICHATGLPLLSAICVNKGNLASGELDPSALAGFVQGARRLGFKVTDELAFHHACRDACWKWGEAQKKGSASIP